MRRRPPHPLIAVLEEKVEELQAVTQELRAIVEVMKATKGGDRG